MGVGVSFGTNFAISKGRVNLNDCSRLFLKIQNPAAFYHHVVTISGGMHQLAFPSSVSNEFGLDLFQWFRELGLQKIVADSAYGFLFLPAIELLSAVVPKINYAVHGARHDAVVEDLKTILRLLYRRHCLLQQVLSCSGRWRR